MTTRLIFNFNNLIVVNEFRNAESFPLIRHDDSTTRGMSAKNNTHTANIKAMIINILHPIYLDDFILISGYRNR